MSIPLAAAVIAAAYAGALAQPPPPPAPAEPAAGSAGWSVVKDDTLGVRPEEAGLYARVLADLAAADPSALKREAAAFLAGRDTPEARAGNVFADVFRHPDAYRGKPVTLTGHARVVREFPGPDDMAAGGGEPPMLVEAWVFPADSGGNPAVVVVSAAPGVPRGNDLLVPVTVTGRFFKKYGYEAHDTTRTAPMLLAGTIERLPEPAAGGATPAVLAAAAGVTLLGLSAGWWAWRGRPKRRGAAAVAGGEAPDLPPLPDLPEHGPPAGARP